MKEEKEKQFRKDSELELSKERKEVRDGRIGLSKDAENKRRLSKAEEKRRTVFEMKKKEFLSQGWHTADLTVGMVYANVMAILLGLPIILFLLSFICSACFTDRNPPLRAGAAPILS